MPRRLIHIIGGFVLALSITGVSYWGFSEDFGYLQLALILSISALTAFSGAILPDIIERPTNPDHRKFFHSWFIFAVMFIASFVMAFVIIPIYDHLFYVYPIFGFCLGYFSHLLLDSTTRRSLT